MALIYILAIFLGMLSYSMLNVGMGLQKKAAASLPKINEQTLGQNLKNFLTNKTWLFGFFLIMAQWGFLVMALDFAPISMITPLMSVGMISLVIFSYFYLKEPLSLVELGGIIAIIIGIVILGVTNPTEEIAESFDETLVKLAQGKAIIFLIIVFIVSIVLVVLAIVRRFQHADVLFGIAAGITDALGAIFIKAYMAGADFRNWGIIHNSVKYWEWWLLLTLLCLFNGLATIYLQVAYQRGRAVIVAPIFSVLAMVVPVLAGVIIFNDWLVFVTTGSIWRIVLKVVAMIVIIAGAVVLSIHSAQVKDKLAKQEEPLEHEPKEPQTNPSTIKKKTDLALIEQEQITID